MMLKDPITLLRINLDGLKTVLDWIVVLFVRIVILIPKGPSNSSQAWSVVFSKWWARFIDVFSSGCLDKGAKNHIEHDA